MQNFLKIFEFLEKSSQYFNFKIMNDNKKQALATALSQIEKQFGAGSIMKLGERVHMRVETSSSGSIALDDALGGGYAKGRIIEIYGPESSGKTTVALHAVCDC